MAQVPDILGTLRQSRSHSMAKAKLIEIIVAREGMARRAETTEAVERMIAFHIGKGRLVSETRSGVEYLSLSE